jgi:hypothetical protein
MKDNLIQRNLQNEILPNIIFHDGFNVDVAAGSVDGTPTTDGKEVRFATDTEDKLSISGGEINWSPKGTPDFSDPNFFGNTGRTRACGLALFGNLHTTDVSGKLVYFGWASAKSTPTIGAFQIYRDSEVLRALFDGSTGAVLSALNSSITALALVLRSAGCIGFAKVNGRWKLVWIDAANSTATMYAGLAGYNSTGSTPYFRVAQLPAPFNKDAGLPTDSHAGNVAATTWYTHEGDCKVEFEVDTIPSDGSIQISFRRVDSTNYYILTINSVGSLVFYSRIDGDFDTIGSIGGVGNGDKVSVTFDGTNISLAVNGVVGITDSSGVFVAATTGQVISVGTGGVVKDFYVYPLWTGLATDWLPGTCYAGDTFTHEADAVLEYTVDTLPSSGSISIVFRSQDSSNLWRVQINSAASCDLYEVVAGSPTYKNGAATAVSNGSRVVVICDDTTINVYVDNALKFTQSSASNFKTATAGELNSLGTGGAVSDIIAWPRYLSGAPLKILENYSRI